MGHRQTHSNTTGHDLSRRITRRLDGEQLVRLADSLPRNDRELIEAYYGEGLTYRDLGRRHRTDARRLQRRIQRISMRMSAPEYRFAVLHHQQLPRRLKRTADLLFIQGQSLRHTARVTGQSLHRVRCDRATLQTLARISA